MPVNYHQTHWDSALVLFRQRQQFPAQQEADATILTRLERQLRLHLHVLGRSPAPSREPQKVPDTFVALAARLSSPVPAEREKGWASAQQYLAEEGPRSAGAFAALSLFPAPADDTGLLELYRCREGLRPTLFRLWRAQGGQIPAGLLNRAELQGRDPVLQQAALEYAADNPQVGPELFRSYYQPLLLAPQPARAPGEALAAALRGGLVRGDRDALRALRRAIELVAGAKNREALLRLAALSGDGELYPILRRHLESNPRTGCHLLALTGRAAAATDLLEALQRAPSMPWAALAWRQLTGLALPLKPRLRLVGSAGQGRPGDFMPDAEAANAWWEEHRATWPAEERRIAGVPMNRSTLIRLALEKAGQRGSEILELLALQLGRPLGFSPEAWQEKRRKALRRFSPRAFGDGVAPPWREDRSHV